MNTDTKTDVTINKENIGEFTKLTKAIKAWKTQARAAIKQGQTLADFVDHCGQSNRPIARKAYLAVRKEQGFTY